MEGRASHRYAATMSHMGHSRPINSAQVPTNVCSYPKSDQNGASRRMTRSAVCHEHRRSKRRCATVREMEEGPSRPAVRFWSQATASCCRQKRWWCCVKKTRERHAVREMKEDPSEPSCRGRLQTAMSCFGQNPRWCCVKKTRERHAVREMKEDPSEPSCRGRLQTAMSCFGQNPRW